MNIETLNISPNSVLSKLSSGAISTIMQNGRKKHLNRGDVLFNHGDSGNFMAIILEGTLKVFINTASGREIVIDYLGVGEASGEMALFSQNPRSASVSAAEKSTIITLSRNQVIPFLEGDGKAAIAVIESLVQRLARTNALLEQHSLPMGAKLAHGLLRLFSEQGSSNSHSFKISQTDLGNHVNLTRENVNRQLKEWERDGFIKMEKGKILITDKQALEEIAEFVL